MIHPNGNHYNDWPILITNQSPVFSWAHKTINIMKITTMNQLLIILISQVPEYPWTEIIFNSTIFNSTEDPINFEDDIDKITTNGGNEVYLILNTDDLILQAYPKEETDEEPFISFTLENIKYSLFID